MATKDDWRLSVICGVHNHPAADHLEGHSYAGRLSEEETLLLVDMSKSMVKPKEILVALKQRDKHNVSIMKTIYNARHKYKVGEMAGRSQMQQLLGQLAEHSYVEWHRNCDNTETVTDLFFAHPVSLELLRSFPHVLIMDCTYKTNRYRLPLLEIVGVTSTDLTFSVAFVYLQYEMEDNYAWALGVLRSVMDESSLPDVIVTDRELALMNAISRIFPTSKNLLCRWHINRNIVVKCKKLFETKDKWDKFIMRWNLLILSSSEEEYIQQLDALTKDFTAYPEALDYARATWLDKYKDRFVAVWTDKCMHYGNTTTNRAESAHAKLKRHLGSSQGNLESAWTKIHNLLLLQHTNIKSSFEKSKTIVQHNFKPAEFKELRGNIAISALDRILGEKKRTNYVGIDVIACGCVMRRTHGLPCAHEIAEYMREGRPIPLQSVHPRWRKLDMLTSTKNEPTLFDCTTELDLIARRFEKVDATTKLQLLKKLREIASPDSTFLVEPEVKSNPRGRSHSKIDDSTRREPCAFELVPSGQDSHSPQVQVTTTKPQKQVTRKRPPKQKVYRTRTVHTSSYVDSFPAGLKAYIHHVNDVQADGNCGFRAIAGLMGFGEDGFIQVRKDLLIELHAHKDHYRQLFGSQQRIDELTHNLSYFEANPGYDRWMTMPDMGHLISSFYNIVLIHLSLQQCLTFLPLRTVPIPTLCRREICLGFVNNNHFIQVFLVPGHPVPPIATNWRRYHQPSAAGWETAYISRIQHFREVIDSDVATMETVELF